MADGGGRGCLWACFAVCVSVDRRGLELKGGLGFGIGDWN